MTKKAISCYLEQYLLEGLGALSEEREKSISSLIRDAVVFWLWKADKLKGKYDQMILAPSGNSYTPGITPLQLSQVEVATANTPTETTYPHIRHDFSSPDWVVIDRTPDDTEPLRIPSPLLVKLVEKYISEP